jgi:hypothetical protein
MARFYRLPFLASRVACRELPSRRRQRVIDAIADHGDVAVPGCRFARLCDPVLRRSHKEESIKRKTIEHRRRLHQQAIAA